MMRRFALIVLAFAFLAAVACQMEEKQPVPLAPPEATQPLADPEQIALTILQETGWPAMEEDGSPVVLPEGAASGKCLVIPIDRQVITGDVVHYTFVVRVGPGAHDQIGLHRVVREPRPGHPIRTKKTVFLQHGASTDFVFCFLPGLYATQIADDFGIAAYLASQDFDVWGIDQRWCLVPPEVTNFDFMATWDFPLHIADLGLAVDAARVLRRLSGNGWGRMHLLGFSFGAEISFGLVDADAQRPPGLRRIKGFIPVDMVIRVPDGSPWQELMCGLLPYYAGQLEAGIYGEGAIFRTVGLLARDDPDGPSPVFEGLTNYQAALALGTGILYGVPPFHLFAGIFDGEMPIALENLGTDAWIELLCRMSYVEANAAALDQAREICGESVDWNRHWGDIRVPVFYVTPRGGFGEAGLYQLDLLGSNDVSTLVISTNPGEILRDYGHLDLFLAGNAEGLVWQPILAWLESQSRP